MRITTWNVLHRIHGVNWHEGPIAAHPDEGERCRAIAAAVAGWLADGDSVVCLQEVSGDQLASLRAAIAAAVHVCVHRYTRVPRLKQPGPAALVDPAEYLVVLARLACTQREATTFADDPGKGFLAVDVDGVLVVDTHVSARERGEGQIALLAAAANAPARAVVAGDFNAPRDVVAARLGASFALAGVAGPTRIATPELAGKTIDHVAVRGCRIANAAVLDGMGLSDHHPVRVELG